MIIALLIAGYLVGGIAYALIVTRLTRGHGPEFSHLECEECFASEPIVVIAWPIIVASLVFMSPFILLVWCAQKVTEKARGKS